MSVDSLAGVRFEDAQVNDGTVEKRLLVALALGFKREPLEGADLEEKKTSGTRIDNYFHTIATHES